MFNIFDIFKDYYFKGDRRPPIKPEDHPEVRWALEIFEPDPNYTRNFFSNYYDPIVISATGFVGASFLNAVSRRPYLAGFQLHILLTATGFLIGVWLRERRNYQYARRDAFLREYILTHPKDFPEPYRPKHGESFRKWTPVH